MQFRTETEILLEMVELAVRKGLLGDDDELVARVRDGSSTDNQYIVDFSTHSRVLSQLEEFASVILQDIDVSRATGEALDTLGRLVGVARYSAETPMVDVELEITLGAAEDVNIPAGTQVLYSAQEGMMDTYVTSEDCSIIEGTTSTTVRAMCTEKGYHRRIEAESVYGLDGFDVSASNSEAGTNGRNIEEDEDYRLRVMSWVPTTLAGTRACITDYLSHYDGLDSYKLIPRYDGVGTLKVVCDTLSTELSKIVEGLDTYCMIETDYPVVCVQPEEQTLSTISLTCTQGDLGTLTEDELTQHIQTQVATYIEGGSSRYGTSFEGLSIGEDFYPSRMIQYLQSQIPEVLNFSMDMSVVSVDDLYKLKCGVVSVTYD